MSDAFFFADPHFGHAAILRHADRPFPNIEAHDWALIERYCAWVAPEDTVYWLGDVALCSQERARRIVGDLPGRKILVRGNHDRGPGAMAALGFDVVADRLTVRMAGHTVVLSHYPYATGVREGDERHFDYPAPTHGWALVHGHIHSRKRRNGTAIHVGVDAWGYQPVPWSEVEHLVRVTFHASEEA